MHASERDVYAELRLAADALGLAIEREIVRMQADIDGAPEHTLMSMLTPYDMRDSNGRLILADLLAAHCNALAVLANAGQ